MTRWEYRWFLIKWSALYLCVYAYGNSRIYAFFDGTDVHYLVQLFCTMLWATCLYLIAPDLMARDYRRRMGW